MVLNAIGTIGAAALGAGASMWGSQQSYSSSKKLWGWQRDWEKQKMQNAHQWEMEDLKKAGINPILAASGSTASSIAAGGGSSAEPIKYDFSGIISAAKALSELKLIKAQEKKTEAETGGILEQNGWISPRAKAEIRNTTESTLLTKAKREQTEYGKIADFLGTKPEKMIKNYTNSAKMLKNAVENSEVYKLMLPLIAR